jgi:hypothetical protein
VARVGVELKIPGTTSAWATLREALVKAREWKERVGEGKVIGQWSFTIVTTWHGMKIPPHFQVGTPLINK